MSGDLATQEIIWLAGAAFLAGLVRGFTGFGTAMVFLPVAGQILSPFAAITTLVIMDIVGPLPLVPRALRDGHPADVVRLAVGLLLALPLGVYALTLAAPETFRYAVSVLSLCLLICLISGIRYRGTLTPSMVYGTGALGGVLGGAAGLPGPPVILLYMASPLPAAAVRANTHLFLILSDVALIGMLFVFDRLVPSALVTGLILIVPYLIANIIGERLFRPEQETLYRRVAYAIIAASALSGLPIWD